MTTPGVGVIVALTFVAAVDDPARFRSSKAVGAHFGLTPRRYQSGETDVTGRLAKIGDTGVRLTLYEAANVILTRPVRGSALKSWLGGATGGPRRPAQGEGGRWRASLPSSCIGCRRMAGRLPPTAPPPRRPRLLVIEDLHWADRDTLDHLATLTQAAVERPAVLVMTSRAEGDPLDHAWRSRVAGSPLTTIDLGPLRQWEAEALAGAALDQALAAG